MAGAAQKASLASGFAVQRGAPSLDRSDFRLPKPRRSRGAVIAAAIHPPLCRRARAQTPPVMRCALVCSPPAAAALPPADVALVLHISHCRMAARRISPVSRVVSGSAGEAGGK
jgi:hypothetical protein